MFAPRIVSALLFGLILVVGCGDDDPSPNGDGPPTVESPDGALAVAFPEGSLPDGVSTDDVSLRALTASEVEQEFGDRFSEDALVYALEPDGLELSSPATFTLSTELETGGSPVVLHVSTSTTEAVPVSIAWDHGTKEAEISGEISHFSVLVVERVTYLFTIEHTAPGMVELGSTFSNTFLWRYEGEKRTFHMDTGDPNGVKEDIIRFIPRFNYSIIGGVVRDTAGKLDPLESEQAPHYHEGGLTVDGLAVYAENDLFTCQIAGTAALEWEFDLTYGWEHVKKRWSGATEREMKLIEIHWKVKGDPVKCDAKLIPTSEDAVDGRVQVPVLMIGGVGYPKYQFFSGSHPDDNCGGQEHWHSDDPVFPVGSGNPINDPDREKCGFGVVGEVPEEVIAVDLLDWLSFVTAHPPK
jgi:hypothetical protein